MRVPSGLNSEATYVIVPFGLITAIAVFFPRLGVFRVHAFWCLVLMVYVQQLNLELDQEELRGDGYRRLAIERGDELQRLGEREGAEKNINVTPLR